MVETLRKLVSEGFSASEIAFRLGSKVTRNAVIGKCERLKIKLQGRPHKNEPFSPSPEVLQIKPVSRPKVPREAVRKEPIPEAFMICEPITDPIEFMDLEPHQCRWPFGDSAPFKFCGADKREGSSYCGFHSKLATSPKPLRPVYCGPAVDVRVVPYREAAE
jgi:GcrA cell cycle regulator